jgi:transposase
MVEVEKHLSREELAVLIREETDPRIKDRLNFIQHLYDGDEVSEAAGKVGYATTTGYNWLHAWNDEGVEGLVPNFGGGRPPKLEPEEEGRFIRLLVEDAPWTTAEIHELLADEFGVEYSERHLRRKLESYGMKYAKPQPYDYRRPEDAEEILDERLQEALDEVEESASDDEEIMTDGGCTVGFFDETFPKPEDVYQRVWDFETPSQEVSVDRFDANTFGFYALNGADAVELMPNSQSESVCKFLRQIRDENPDGPLIVILDNYPSHHANEVKELADELGIQLVFLPKYSPHLNPIEPLWRELKYVLSRMFVTDEDAFQSLIQETFDELSAKLSYAVDWIDTFFTDFKRLRQ